MTESDKLFEEALKHIRLVQQDQRVQITQCARMLTDCIVAGGIGQLCTTDSGKSFSMELNFRAGGLMPFHQFNTRDLALRKVMEPADITPEAFDDDPSKAAAWWGIYNIDPADMFFISSPYGNEAVLVEIAMMAREKGHKVVAVTDLASCAKDKATHPSGKKINELADLVFDIGTGYPDSVVDVDGHAMGHLSSILNDVLAQMITAETYRCFKQRGLQCPVLLSMNVTGADVHNKAISDRYDGRWNS